jgi:glutamate-1-semialdehyde 2,1-aminomutase
LRNITREYGALLIFDEVMTGFRVSYGGAQALYRVTPDLTCLGKVIGGGLPVGAYGGTADIMRQVAPSGPVYQAGTLSGNPLAMSAGIATLRRLQSPDVYPRLSETARALASGFESAGREVGIPIRAGSAGSMWGFFFASAPVTDYDSAKKANTDLYARFFHRMLAHEVYLAPSQFESAFVSTEHGLEEIDRTVEAAYDCLRG